MRLIVALLLLISSISYAGDLYIWVDDSGVKHFSNSPVPSQIKDRAVESIKEIEHDPEKDAYYDAVKKHEYEAMMAAKERAEAERARAEAKREAMQVELEKEQRMKDMESNLQETKALIQKQQEEANKPKVYAPNYGRIARERKLQRTLDEINSKLE